MIYITKAGHIEDYAYGDPKSAIIGTEGYARRNGRIECIDEARREVSGQQQLVQDAADPHSYVGSPGRQQFLTTAVVNGVRYDGIASRQFGREDIGAGKPIYLLTCEDGSQWLSIYPVGSPHFGMLMTQYA